MRENMGMYRGKPKHKEEVEYSRPDVIRSDGFIYGNLVVADGKYFICTYAVCSHKTYVNNTRATMFEVIPETVGEFTSLPDKNGKKIFEGDIIRTTNPYTGEEYVGVVEWGCYYTFGVGFVIAWNSDDDDLNPSLFYWVNDVGVEVVGNCYDNPELLEGGKYNG